jgi:hypothetical protein
MKTFTFTESRHSARYTTVKATSMSFEPGFVAFWDSRGELIEAYNATAVHHVREVPSGEA